MRERIKEILVKALHAMMEDNQGIIVKLNDDLSYIVCKERDEATGELHLKIYDNEDDTLEHGELVVMEDKKS